MIRVWLPYHLRTLANVSGEVELVVAEPCSLNAVLDALECRFPMLQGTIRERSTGKRRAFLRFFACEADLSNHSLMEPLPPDVVAGREPLLIVGAIAGG
jgi:hypothetical protein